MNVANRTISLRGQWLLLFCLAICSLAYVGMAALHLTYGKLTHAVTPQTIGLYLTAFAAFLLAIWAVERQPRRAMLWIWGGALLFRLLLLFTTPTLSDDVYRYLWDGHVANHGVSPYALPIEAPELDYLDVPVRSLANHTWMASPYLPAAQWLFAGLTRWLPLQPLTMQMAMLAIDLATGALLIGLLRIAALPARRAILYLWNPLVVVEVAHGAHVDAWMVFLTMLALWLTFLPAVRPAPNSSGRRTVWRAATEWAPPFVLALATLTKLLPGLLLPVLFWRWRWRELLIYGAATLLLLVPSGLRAGWGLSGPLDGRGLFAAIRIYGNQWNFNSGIFYWLETNLPVLGLEVTDATRWAKRVVALLLLSALFYVWLRARRATEPRQLLRLMIVPLAAYLLLTPTVHPWYSLIVLAFVPFLAPGADEPRSRWLWVYPWLYLSAALVLSYLTYLDPNDLREYAWIRRVEWLPTLGLLALAWGWPKLSRRTTTESQADGWTHS